MAPKETKIQESAKEEKKINNYDRGFGHSSYDDKQKDRLERTRTYMARSIKGDRPSHQIDTEEKKTAGSSKATMDG